MTSAHSQTRQQYQTRASAGFTLLELVVAMAVFLVLGSAAVKLANQSVGVSMSQQGQSALNISVRNASAQMQIDLINAGTGYFPTYNIPGAPLGIVISNVNSKLDTLTILSFDPTIVAHPTNAPTYTTSNTITVTPVGISAAALAAGYNTSSNPIELMMFSNTVNASSGMPYITTFPISGASAGSSTVTVNISTPNVAPVVGSTGTWPADPLGISSSYGVSDLIQNADGSTSPGICYLSDGVSPMPAYDTTDWVLKVNSVVYAVNTSNQLTRTVNGTTQVIADNVMSFRVGALLYGGSSYNYLPTNPINDPRQIRSVRVSLIGSTTPDPSSPFRNTYDGGPYRVEGTSFIVNPRNLSLHD
jgi:prepilin-type N-terminal cleavage/methylation domain-containing protein